MKPVPPPAIPLLVLASNSPRRREIIGALDTSIECVDPGYDEGMRLQGEGPEQFAHRLASGKALAAASLTPRGIVIGADTIVALEGHVLGKPESVRVAVEMLERLRGRPHHVYTAVCAVDAETGRVVTGGADTLVTMRDYSDAELEAYVATGEPFDKAGAYGVQDMRFRPADSVDGCYLNVVGLPLCITVGLIRQLGAMVRLDAGWRPPDGCRPCEVPPSEGDATRPARLVKQGAPAT